MRGATRRAWIKLYITGMLHGSVRWELTPEERATWIDLLLLAGECNKSGLICDNDGKAFPLAYVANSFNISIKLLERTLEKCMDENRIGQEGGILRIKNWEVYQSEYERQKSYRQKRDPRMAPYESEADFQDRLKLFGMEGTPPPPEEVQRQINKELMAKAVGRDTEEYRKAFVDERGGNKE